MRRVATERRVATGRRVQTGIDRPEKVALSLALPACFVVAYSWDTSYSRELYVK